MLVLDEHVVAVQEMGTPLHFGAGQLAVHVISPSLEVASASVGLPSPVLQAARRRVAAASVERRAMRFVPV
jgi:hypothetical protein